MLLACSQHDLVCLYWLINIHFFYALATVSVCAKLFFNLLLLIAIMAGLFYFDKASKRRFFSPLDWAIIYWVTTRVSY